MGAYPKWNWSPHCRGSADRPSAISPIVMSTRLHDQSEDVRLWRGLVGNRDPRLLALRAQGRVRSGLIHGTQAVTRSMRVSGSASLSFKAFCSTKLKRERVNGVLMPSDS